MCLQAALYSKIRGIEVHSEFGTEFSFRTIFTSVLAQGNPSPLPTTSYQLLFQMCLPAETTGLMFGGYEHIPSHIFISLCFWTQEWNLVLLCHIAPKVRLGLFSDDFEQG